jgi:BioD-like phosphotransacetylase family protein
MKSLYITSVERHSGKTATCLALGKRFQSDGYRVGYVKPLSMQPWQVGTKVADEDAAFAKEVLGLVAEPWELSPVVVTIDFLLAHLRDRMETDHMQKVKEACDAAGADKDILLLEGGGSLREGYIVGLPTPIVAASFGSIAVAIVKYRDEVRVLDDALTAQTRLEERLCGILVNRVPPSAATFVSRVAVPFLEDRGIPVLGVLPEARSLEALTVSELIDALEAEVITQTLKPERLVETLTIGAMTSEAALSLFRKQRNKAVITGGHRTDIQLAALETSTICLILTDNISPSPLIVKQADEFGVTVLLVRTNTLETIEAIELIYGKTRLGQTTKLQQFEVLLAKHLDIDRIYQALDL